MKFGLAYANTGAAATPDGAVALAHVAEEAGFESLWTVEHVVVPAGYESQYPYSPDGRMPGGEDAPIPDPLIWLTWVAAASSTLRLGTGVVILPQRNPVVLAKEVATLDVLSRGRVLLGIGVGWLQEEFDAIGVPFEERGARTDEYVDALRTLWRDAESTHHGRFVHFERAQSYPKPVQPGGVPIVVGGHSPAAARRAGRLGDGFFPAQGRFDVLPGLLDTMRTAAEDAGRDPDAIEVTTGTSLRADVDMVKRYEDLGIDRLVVPSVAADRLRAFGDEVISRLG